MSDKRKDYEERDEGFLGYPFHNDKYARQYFEPWYNDKTDYNTNAPSYYDYLARMHKLMHLLSDRIWEYDKELAKRFEEWDKRIEHMPSELKRMLEEWMKDGTLDEVLNEDLFYNEIYTEEYPGNKSLYYVTTVPPKDKYDDKIILEKGISYDDFGKGASNGLETTLEHAVRNTTSLTTNASIFDMDNNLPYGVHIEDGKVLKNKMENDKPNYILTYNKNTQELKSYPPKTTGEELLKYGITDAWTGFFPIIIDYKPTSENMWGVIDNTKVKNPRQVIAQMEDKTIKFFTFRGREDDYPGYDYYDLQDILREHNVKFAYNLDGGGSTSTVKSNVVVNPPIDRNFGDLRKTTDFINVIKTTKSSFDDFYRVVGKLSKNLKKTEARTISKYGDEIPGRLHFADFFYINNDKAMYGKTKSGGLKRILGLYENDRIYLGNEDTPISIQTSNNISVDLAGDKYRMNLTSEDDWKNVNLNSNAKNNEEIPLEYKRFNAFETRVRGNIYINDSVENNSIIGSIPENSSPSTVVTVPVVTINGEREFNAVTFLKDGNIRLLYKPTEINNDTQLQIEAILNREY